MRGKGNNYNVLRENMMELEIAYRRLLEDKAHQEDNMRVKLNEGNHEQNGI